MGWEKDTAAAIFDAYRRKRGSQQIASEFALHGLLKELERRKPAEVLELGPGIGATTQTLVAGLDRTVGRGGWTLTAVEENAFCNGELVRNLGPDAERITIVDAIDALDRDTQTYDLVLVDGPGSARGYFDRLRPRAVVFVENLRHDQRNELTSLLGDRSWVTRSAWPFFTTEQMGGYHVFQLDPSPWEQASYPVRAAVQRGGCTARVGIRRVLGRLHLTAIITWFEARADGHRITAAEFADPRVMAEGPDA